MILVLLGTQNNSFHRLLEEIEENIKDGTINKFKSRVSNYKKKPNGFVILKYFIIS